MQDSFLLDGLKKLVDPIVKRGGDARPTTSRVVKPAKIPTWSKEMSMETYVKQIENWEEINADVLENTRYQDFVESLKIKKEI